MILRRRRQVSAGLVWSGLRVGEGRETHLAARRRHSCAMPRRSAALASRRRAGSSAACRPRVLWRPMQAPTPLGSRRRSGAGLGQAAGGSGWGVSLFFLLPQRSCVSPRSVSPPSAVCAGVSGPKSSLSSSRPAPRRGGAQRSRRRAGRADGRGGRGRAWSLQTQPWPLGALSGLIVRAPSRRPRCSGFSSRGGSPCSAGATCRRASAAPSFRT